MYINIYIYIIIIVYYISEGTSVSPLVIVYHEVNPIIRPMTNHQFWVKWLYTQWFIPALYIVHMVHLVSLTVMWLGNSDCSSLAQKDLSFAPFIFSVGI